MYQYQDQKEMRRALNGKMIIMLVGIMLVVTALTSSLSYGVRCWSMAGMADGGDEEILKAMKQIGVSSGTLRACSIIYYIDAFVETLIGVFCIRLNNRLDKIALLWKMAWVILGVEVVAGVALVAMHMVTPLSILSNIFLPAFLFWAISGLKKVAKNHPDRIYAVEPNRKKKGQNGTSAQPAKPAQKKSLMERATQVTPADITPLDIIREQRADSEPVQETDEPEHTEETQD